MALLQQLKNEWITKAAFAFTGGALDRGGFTKNLVAAVRSMARHRLAEGTMLLAGSQYVAAMVGLVTNIVSARLLGPKDFGLAALVLSYPLLLGSLMAVKSGWVTTRYISRFRAEGRAQSLGAICKLGYALDMTVSLIATLLVLVTAPWVAREFFHAPEITWLIIAYAACFPIWSLLGTSQALLTAFERFRWVGLLQVLDHVIGSLLVIGLLLGGYGVAGVVLGSACGNVLIALIAAGAANAVLRREQLGSWWRCSVRQVGVSRKEITGLFGWNYLLVTGSGLLSQLPLMILAHLRGPEAAGFFRLAASIVMVGSYLETSMGKVVYPVLSARWHLVGGAALRPTLMRWTVHVGLPVCVLLLISLPLYPMLIPLVFGPHYAPMAPGVQIMITGAALSAPFFWLNSIYYASGHLDIWTVGYAAQFLAVLGVAWWAVPIWGFSGMAVMTAIGRAGFTVAMLWVFYNWLSVERRKDREIT